MMRSMVLAVSVLAAGFAFGQESPPPIVNGQGAAIKDLAGSGKYVTVVLKDSGALDANLRILDVGPSSFSVMTEEGERTAYLFSSVKEIRVQDNKVDVKKFNLDENRSLRVEEQRVVTRALERAQEFLGGTNVDQALKMKAATILAVDNRREAIDYLRRLASSNNLETQLDAAIYLYITGNYEANPALTAQGLQSGNRKVQSKAALLAGLAKDTSCIDILNRMVQDLAVEICAPAARALGRLGERSAIPALFRMLQELNPQKGNAAVFALARLGGPEVVNEAKALLKDAVGVTRHRIALLLYKLDDPLGKKLLIDEMRDTPTLAADAALVLAKTGHWDSMQLLLHRLSGRYDETTEVMLFRARAAVACIQGGDPSAISMLQELMRTDDTEVRTEICALLVEMGKRRMITVLQPMIESTNGEVAMNACMAVVALARPDFREKLLEMRN